MKKIVLTGAAGRLGSYLREPLLRLAQELVSSDIIESIGTLHPNETYVRADLSDLSAMIDLLKGADMVVHFGAIGDEAPFDAILQANIIGAYNIWEAAHQNGVKRVVYASSIHAVGMHKKTDFIGTDVPHRPDTYYGLAKCFAEDLASLYWDKRGLESVCMRILSCSPVANPRAIGSWQSYDDLILLVEKSITTQVTGFSIIYGVSNNDRVTVNNAQASHIGYLPKDNAEQYASKIFAEEPMLDPNSKGSIHQGGPFASVELGKSGLATMKIKYDKK
ncbi:NAD(P)-dependent oxidoreductase [Amylibacter sp.]|nr:NAD(P)-dependent oxidoreductase [Amylibacter sp.]